jgi:hypothetical protein
MTKRLYMFSIHVMMQNIQVEREDSISSLSPIIPYSSDSFSMTMLGLWFYLCMYIVYLKDKFHLFILFILKFYFIYVCI